MNPNLKTSRLAAIGIGLLVLVLFFTMTPAFAQKTSLTGTYGQDVIELPKGVTESENNLIISQDPASSKKIWITNLLEGTRIYALITNRGDERITYQVPSQVVNGYSIKTGWVIYDKEDNKLTISINNGVDNVGKPGKVNVGANGNIDAGDVKIGKNGRISAPGVDISKAGVKVDYAKAMGGISYVGHKAGLPKKDDDQ